MAMSDNNYEFLCVVGMFSPRLLYAQNRVKSSLIRSLFLTVCRRNVFVTTRRRMIGTWLQGVIGER